MRDSDKVTSGSNRFHHATHAVCRVGAHRNGRSRVSGTNELTPIENVFLNWRDFGGPDLSSALRWKECFGWTAFFWMDERCLSRTRLFSRSRIRTSSVRRYRRQKAGSVFPVTTSGARSQASVGRSCRGTRDSIVSCTVHRTRLRSKNRPVSASSVRRATACRAMFGPNLTDERLHKTGVAWDGQGFIADRGAGGGDFKTPTLRDITVRLPTCTMAVSPPWRESLTSTTEAADRTPHSMSRFADLDSHRWRSNSSQHFCGPCLATSSSAPIQPC